MITTQRWDFHELVLTGPRDGNPFVEVELFAEFSAGQRTLRVPGFYDGEGTYRVRLAPDALGPWTWRTHSNRAELDNITGQLECVAPQHRNHGPVRVHNVFHFAYADGTPYWQLGTTCYAWTHQPDDLQEQTLRTLSTSPFNKLRMCVFPKNYAYNKSDPPRWPYVGTPPDKWDTRRFELTFFQHLEKQVARLRDLGIEADIILFHPYDGGRWGFDRMDEDADDLYLRYVVARLAAFCNVWWSMANEFDFMREKKPTDWDRYFRIVRDHDPYQRLRSIHNGRLIYDHNQPWVTHASIQNGSAVEDFGRAILYRDVYRKPVVFDEVKYEGNIPQRWGNLSPEEMVHRFWQGTIAGTYVGHGETYLHPRDILWWAAGGVLHGQSPPRLAFLRRVLEESNTEGLEPIDKWQDVRTCGKAGEFYLVYFGHERPKEWEFSLPRAQLAAGMNFTVDILDTWNMTVTPVEGVFTIVTDETYRYHAEGRRRIPLPGLPFIALRIRRVAGDEPKQVVEQHLVGEG